VELEQVTVKPQAEVLGSTPALLLGGAINVLDEFDYVGSFTENSTVWVRLAPRSVENGFTRVELGFTDGNLSRMVFSDNLQQSTLIALFDAEFGVAIDASRFVLSLPSYVDVIGVPVVAGPADF
jgi:outer membrane lipoprotein carrier protein